LAEIAKRSPSKFLACWEEIFCILVENILPRSPIIIQALYDSDILEEDDILAWNESKNPLIVEKEEADSVKKHCHLFIEWLQEEEGDEDNGEDGLEESTEQNGKDNTETAE